MSVDKDGEMESYHFASKDVKSGEATLKNWVTFPQKS